MPTAVTRRSAVRLAVGATAAAATVLLTGCTKILFGTLVEDTATTGDTSSVPPAESAAEAVLISAEEAHEMMEDGDVVVLDVRERDEYDAGHIAGAVLLPYTSVSAQTAAEAIPSKDSTVLVYCRSGRRSAIAAEALVDLGYQHVYDFGGILSWPYETVTE